ncbi:MAG: DUF3035 domain-containing protein [Phenylobacterium sp.]|uniref:DUF3035 domain-containing protein n=1 Tax=Phenylobacterium sp. TaxID=1871053 RepID=UPI0008C061A2|nr:DUF3035 domain-containing protein [Phenylobacterium sp.]MBA4793146.1 DUF3035 domain-containing protein [Phenylobacterium sp.]OHB34396.1 MAG: beta-barrel assembly machine subunit BamF [Phenylobacterium sp. RIFCSPHIGHO2_01_FULL_70_10]
MTLNRMILAGALTAAVGLAGCTSTRQALGMTKVTPDEFRVVTKAPLVVPPDYALRPPAPGEPRPQELQPESAARAALLGEREAAGRSQGEQLLVAKAGVERADPLIRYVVDDEFGDIAHKEKSFADTVMFWRDGASSPTPSAPGAEAPAPVDAAAEEQRINEITGGGDVVIRRESSGRIKLPGL